MCKTRPSVPAGTFADDFSGALIALRVPIGTFVTGAYLNKCSRKEHSRANPSTRETCALDEARDDAIGRMISTVGVPAGTFGETFNASQGFADSTECSCRNTCGLAHASFDKALPASVRRALAAARLRYAEVFLQEHLSSSNV